jgi:outer membrane receptor protein involved in Fe transport
MPAKLDDLCSSRKITKGFKLANPNLQPEHLLTYEIGGNLKIGPMLRFDAALFFSEGQDFQYFVATGDSIDTGGADIKPIVKRDNITSVEVYGGEFTARFTPAKWLLARASYSFNHSTIVNFEVDPLINIDLTGNGLAEVPQDKTSVEVFYINNKVVNLGIIWTRIGKQWGDDINSYYIEPWNTFDLRVWKEYRNVKISMDIFDLLDNPYIDKKGLMSPGRYFLFSVEYNF